jgi:hypothetical protein
MHRYRPNEARRDAPLCVYELVWARGSMLGGSRLGRLHTRTVFVLQDKVRALFTLLDYLIPGRIPNEAVDSRCEQSRKTGQFAS